MPTDHRRIQGPEETTPYSLYVKTRKSYTEILSKLKNNERKDGRQNDKMRPLYMKTGIVSQAKGSAYIEQNATKVICSVFDPREIPHKSEYSLNGELYCEFKFAPFSCANWRAHQQDSEEKDYSLLLRKALEPAVCRHEFPNFQVDIYALVLENDGSALAAAITCAGLALADASVPMYDIVVASAVGMHGDLLLIDPGMEEEILCNTAPPEQEPNGNHGMITAAFLPAHKQTSAFSLTGALHLDCIASSLKRLIEICEMIYPLSQLCLQKSVADGIKKKCDPRLDLSSDKIAF